jgi:hypothetical protein
MQLLQEEGVVMDAFTRLALMNLLGELLTEKKTVQEVERSFRQFVGDEKVRSYELGLKDGREKWGM